MAKAVVQEKKIEREYVIPLRREWMKVPKYKRTAKGVRAIKEFIAKHMRVPDRNTDNVKLDVYLNNEVWFKGTNNPPSKIKVRAVKEGDIVKVEFVTEPRHIKFARARHEKYHSKIEKKKAVSKVEEKRDDKKEDEKKKDVEKEKEESVAKVREAQASQAAKVQKHIIQGKEPQVHRKALKK
jgi:large subunit ribosomal protein L31e